MTPSPADSPSLADVLIAVEQAVDLPADRRRDLRSAVHRIADILGTRPEHLPASLQALRPRLQKIAPAAHGISKKPGRISGRTCSPPFISPSRAASAVAPGARRHGSACMICSRASGCVTPYPGS